MNPQEAYNFIRDFFQTWRKRWLDATLPEEEVDQWRSAADIPKLVEALRVLDQELTGKTENRRASDLKYATRCVLEGEPWLIYLSDGGYSRLTLDPMYPTVFWMDRGLSLDKPKARAEALGIPLR